MIPRYLPGNQLTLLQSSSDFIPALAAALEQATRSIYLESYIFKHDAVGARIADILMQAARRGVATRLLIDGFGSHDYPPGQLAMLRAAGVDVLVYRPKVSPWTLRKVRLRRMHRKLAVIDDHCAFVGGINIIQDHTGRDGQAQFDFAVQVRGPLVAVIAYSMAALHRLVAWTQFRTRPTTGLEPHSTPDPAGTVRAAFLRRSNWQHRREIERAYLRAIGKAREEILIANAYFLPSRRFRRALLHAAQRGVRVQLLLQGLPEFRWVQNATRAMYHELLAAGIGIHEYQPSVLHAKVAVIDGQWTTVGSSNIEPTSLFLAREANIVAFDRQFAADLRQRLLHAITHDARAVTHEDWRHASWLQKLRWGMAYTGVRLLAAWVGYGREMG